MSEYQYYEFLALDRRLSTTEIAELREISSRAEISPQRFCNVYHYGDFRGDPIELMKSYFDIMVYITNWGTHQLLLRLPKDAVDRQALRACCDGYLADVHPAGDNIIFEFNAQLEEYYDWEEGEGRIQSLLPLREEILRGDLRAPYLAWLMCAQYGDFEEHQREPFIPPGLKNLSPALSALAEYLWLDQDLLAAAAELSPGQQELPDRIDEWIAALPEPRKNQILRSVIDGQDLQIGAKLLREYRQSLPQNQQTPTSALRSIAELQEAAARIRTARKAEEQRLAAEAHARQEAAAAAAREQRLDRLAKRQAEAWQDIERLVELKQAKPYQEAAQLLRDLYDLSVREKRPEQFQTKLEALRQQHCKKRTFWERVKGLGIG